MDWIHCVSGKLTVPVIVLTQTIANKHVATIRVHEADNERLAEVAKRDCAAKVILQRRLQVHIVERQDIEAHLVNKGQLCLLTNLSH
jgi:hypothetical protein